LSSYYYYYYYYEEEEEEEDAVKMSIIGHCNATAEMQRDSAVLLR